MVARHPLLNQHLLAYNAANTPQERAQHSQAIWQALGCERTVLVLDMSGFSRLSEQHGIVHYLAMIQRMQDIAKPSIHACGGQVVKFEADNCFAVFAQPAQALEAAQALNSAFAQCNCFFHEDCAVQVSCGIDHGNILLLPHDLYGTPVNTASRLGEDLATPGQVLITAQAVEQSLPALPAATAARLLPLPPAAFPDLPFGVYNLV